MMNQLFPPKAYSLLEKALKEVFPYNQVTYGRLTDTKWIFDHLGDDPEIKIHEFGAWHTDVWKAFATKYRDLTITDSFGWSERDYAKSVQSPLDWMEEIQAAGHKTEQVDVQMMIAKETFDIVCSVSAIEHVVDDELGLTNIFKSLKPGGKFVFTTEMNMFQSMSYNPDIYFRVYSPNELFQKLRDAGFTVDPTFAPTEDPEFEAKMREAIGNPTILRFPYQHFCAAGICVKKPE